MLSLSIFPLLPLLLSRSFSCQPHTHTLCFAFILPLWPLVYSMAIWLVFGLVVVFVCTLYSHLQFLSSYFFISLAATLFYSSHSYDSFPKFIAQFGDLSIFLFLSLTEQKSFICLARAMKYHTQNRREKEKRAAINICCGYLYALFVDI